MQVYNNEIYHHGILGMKWGHHKHIQDTISVKKAQQNLVKSKEAYITVKKNKSSMKKRNDAARELRYSKEDLKNAKILANLNSKTKSEYQLKMEEKYKKKGMSDDESAVAAYNNIRTKKALVAVGAVTLTMAAAYVAYNHWDNNVDKIIKSGTTFQNISSESDKGLRNNFYASTNKLDKIKYKGVYGSHLKPSGEVLNKQIKVLSDIKQASYKNAHVTLQELAKNDKDFVNKFHSIVKERNKGTIGGLMTKTDKTFASAEKSLSKGIIDKKVYEAFNISLTNHTPEMQTLTDKYFKSLTNKGYNAIKDINDSKYSGYGAINPIISFNTKGKVELSKVAKISNSEINKTKIMSIGMLSLPEIAGQAFMSVGTTVTAKIIKDMNNNNKIKKYRNEHPDSKMTNTEIIRTIERQNN